MDSNGSSYNFGRIEDRWHEIWEENRTFRVTEDLGKKKYYVLDMFPYPSGAGLHIGHPEGYTATDIIARYKRACGYNVLHPMGWDAFGLPAEQHAIKTGVNPAVNTEHNIEHFRAQIKRLGFAIDWSREVNTTDPNYYRWTQWIFLQLFKHGLAYTDERPVWWCNELKSVLANEEVINGRSERGNYPVERRNLRQWVLRITKYADQLLDGLHDLDWPESTKRQQILWIGKSTGACISFAIKGRASKVKVYTTRPDTLYGVTGIVLAPEHELVAKIITPNQRQGVREYLEAIRSKSDLERTDLAKTKTGVFTGAYAINPMNGELVPIWVADYVLPSYGTGAVMMVPAHDARDYEFAKKYGLKIKQVLKSDKDLPFCDDGELINSGEFDGLSGEQARDSIIAALEKQGVGQAAVNYKLRDWLFSRQRYWGEPIPVIWIDEKDYEYVTKRDDFYFREFLPEQPVKYGDADGVFCALPLTSKELPLVLPEMESYLPSENGESPLARDTNWVNVYVEAVTGKIISAADFRAGTPGLWVRGRRETNTMPQWAGSCWYYLRYMSPRHSTALVEESSEKYWEGPDLYVGGAEHAVLHLLYARFWHKFLYNIGIVSTDEPFKRLFHQGIILGEDGSKMSKSLGNVINPDDIIDKYGADAFRLYEMFLGPLDAMKPWNSRGIDGTFRFLSKIWKTYIDENGNARVFEEESAPAEQKMIDETIQKVTQDIEILHFNTAISQMMICLNFLLKEDKISKRAAFTLLQLLAPFAPHITEELYHRLGGTEESISDVEWPKPLGTATTPQDAKIVVQFNGKARGAISVPRDTSETALVDIIKSDLKLSKYLENKEVIKNNYVPNKVINFLIK
ncbi:MAG: leucine--tRNA ligase [Opitutales bacterium]|nr:leucine--tRNA ligase [Opitutales bacterium]